MTMTKQHFQFIAEAIRASDVAPAWKMRMVSTFANRLEATNPNFDREKFFAAALEDDGDRT